MIDREEEGERKRMNYRVHSFSCIEADADELKNKHKHLKHSCKVPDETN